MALADDMGKVRRLELNTEVHLASGISEVFSMEVALGVIVLRDK